MAEVLNVENKIKVKRQKIVNDHLLKKRAPPRYSQNENDVYVTNKSNFKAQLVKCEKLLDANKSEIIIHGLGAAIQRTVLLALQIKEKYQDTCEINITTSTVTITDDLEPLTEEGDYETQVRLTSAIQIKIIRTI